MHFVRSATALNGGRGTVTLRRNFALNLKRLLRESEFNQRGLAEKLGMSETMVSKWVNEQAFPEERQIESIVGILKVDYEDLFRDPQVGPRPPSDPVVKLLRDLLKQRGYDTVKKS